MTPGRIALLLIILALTAGFFIFDLGSYFTLGYIKSQQDALNHLVNQQPLLTATLFFAIYVVVTAMSFPGAAVMTLAAGAIFGLGFGVLLVSFASSIGATLAMLVARYVLRDQVQNRFHRQLKGINQGVDKDGAFYLFTLRLVPVVPFFVINLAMGLTRIKAPLFYFVSQIGMLAGTIVYVNAGTQLAEIDSLAGILSPGLLVSFALLGVFPLIARRMAEYLRVRRVLARFPRPAAFDRDLVVIGAGSGGLVAALIAATVRARVTLIEKNKMGGDCLNTGCVPSKALIRSAKFLNDASRARSLGFDYAKVDFEFRDVMSRVQRVIKTIEPHDSIERYESLGVNVESGYAKILSPYKVEVNGNIITTRNIIVASGATPFVPPIKGLDQIDYLTSDNVWDLKELPNRLIVLGGGPIGTELSQTFSRLGSEVTQMEMMSCIMSREDPEISEMIANTMRSEGVTILTDHMARSVVVEGQTNYLIAEHEGSEVKIPFDQILIAVGRKASVNGFGLEELDVEFSDHGTIQVNEYLQTNYPNIYAVGDVAGPYQFTHTASHMAWYATVNALFGTFRKFKVDYRVIPWATFSSPEVARVGLNETDAKAQGIDYEVTRYDVAELDRAIADEEGHGLVKVLTRPGSDRILGVTIVADHAGDLIAEYVLAMKHRIGLNKILATIHIYPTLSEMNKYAASEWRKKHKPEWALKIAERYHRWRRGSSKSSSLKVLPTNDGTVPIDRLDKPRAEL